MTEGSAVATVIEPAISPLKQGVEVLSAPQPDAPALSEKALAALEAAGQYAGKAHALATRRAYQFDWMHYAAWCQDKGFVPMPAEPIIVGAYFTSLAETHAPNTIRRRLTAIGRAHRFNDLPWNPSHRDIQEPLRGVLREHGRPPMQAGALTLALLQRLLDSAGTCKLAGPAAAARSGRVWPRHARAGPCLTGRSGGCGPHRVRVGMYRPIRRRLVASASRAGGCLRFPGHRPVFG